MATAAYGVKLRFLGITVAKRQTFLIDPDGNVAKHYENVDPDTHSKEVLADLARNVAGDRLQVASIVKPGAEIHGYQPTPSDIERASKADLIVVLNDGLIVEQGTHEELIEARGFYYHLSARQMSAA